VNSYSPSAREWNILFAALFMHLPAATQKPPALLDVIVNLAKTKNIVWGGADAPDVQGCQSINLGIQPWTGLPPHRFGCFEHARF